MSRNRFGRVPVALRRSGVHLDNIALIPASQLPYKAHWQQLANDLPDGDILIVLPFTTKQQRIARFVAFQLTQRGKQVRVIDRELQQNVR